MRLVLEGPDGAGKTTLAQNIIAATRYDTLYTHEGPPPPAVARDGDALEAYYLEQLVETAPHRIHVMDRWAVGERVYGPLFRAGDVLGYGRLERLLNTLRIAGDRCVVCLPPYERVLDNWRAKKRDMTTSPESLRAAYDMFLMLAEAHRLERYDYTKGESLWDWFPRELGRPKLEEVRR